ncbi:MAG: bifunctional histidinol-phosphatase/imidazoleglycerol-phosphate dehydratase HisB [Woeseia sp.]
MADKVLFIDRDGTLIEEPVNHQVDSLDKVRLVPGVVPALNQLADSGYRLVMVTNQDGLGTDSFPERNFRECQDFVLSLFESQGIVFDEIFVCPHLPEDACECRKPRTGLLTRYLARTDIDTEKSAVIGDRDTDLQMADALGLRGFLISDGADQDWATISRTLNGGIRQASLERNTRETAIHSAVNLDDESLISIDTGIGFYDHMLEQIARHGGFSLRMRCSGDLNIDEHHTVEDTAICLGTVIRRALGDKRGIGRYGFVLPMDESECRVSLDLSGRAYFAFEGDFSRERVGGLPTELVKHFFRSFADSVGAGLHIAVSGENAHHMVEACFKSVGRALRQAIRHEGTELPSTKGTLS